MFSYTGRCLNGGLCRAVASGLYQCHCPPSHFGHRCEQGTYIIFTLCHRKQVSYVVVSCAIK